MVISNDKTMKIVNNSFYLFLLYVAYTLRKACIWLQSRWILGSIVCKRIRDASIYTSKKISLKFLFLSDIFLFPFIRQQFPVLT